MAHSLEHEMEAIYSEDLVINPIPFLSNDMQIENPIIALNTYTLTTTGESKTMLAKNPIKDHLLIQDIKNSLHTKEKAQTNPDSKTLKSSEYRKSTSFPPTNGKSTNHLCPTTDYIRLPASLTDGDGTDGSCSLFQSPNKWAGDDSHPPKNPTT